MQTITNLVYSLDSAKYNSVLILRGEQYYKLPNFQ
jgi:hypothetical protein